MMKKETLKTNANANVIANAILQNKSFCDLYHITDANMNTSVETQSNRVTEIQEELSIAKEIIETMKLDDFFLQAVKRIRVYIDSNAFVVFFGAVFTAQSALAKLETSDRERLTELFNKSIDKKYNNRKQREHTITADTETRHSFDSLDEFCEFIQLMQKAVMLRKEEHIEEKREAEQKKEKEQKQKTKSRKQKQKANLSSVSADDLAEMTKAVIEAEQKKA